MNHEITLVFVHGFLGGAESTFLTFPTTIAQHASTLLKRKVTSKVYPSYSTSGKIERHVDQFVQWLRDSDEWRRACHVILCGHSMGGILIADALMKLAREGDAAQVKGVIALDAPYYGITGRTFKSKLDLAGKVVSGVSKFARSASPAPDLRARSASPSPSESSSRIKLVGGIIAAVAASAAVAFLAKDKIASLGTTVGEHIDFLDPLAQEADLQHTRVEGILQTGTPFACLYVKLMEEGRTFIVLPPESTRAHFRSVKSTAQDEVEGHMNMFEPSYTMLKEFGEENMMHGFLETLWSMVGEPQQRGRPATSGRESPPQARHESPFGKRVLLKDGTIAYIQ